MMNRWIVLLAAGTACLFPITVSGQSARSVAVDVSIGLGRGIGGGELPGRAMISGGLALVASVRPLPHGSIAVGAAAAADGPINAPYCVGLVCPRFPELSAIGFLVGWTQRQDQSSGFRLLAGPAYVTNTSDDGGLGALIRADVAVPVTRWFALIGVAQGTAAPRFMGSRVGAASVGVGFRVH